MKHWIAVLCVAAALALGGLLTEPQDAEDAAIGSTVDTASRISGGLLAGAALLGVIALVGLAREFSRSDDT